MDNRQSPIGAPAGVAKPALLGCLAALVLAALAAPLAQAASPLKVREVFPGSTAAGTDAEFVELQMTADGQGDVDGQVVEFYDASGALASSYTLPSDVANGGSQRTILLATQEAVTAAVVPAPDFNMGSGTNRMSPAGGAACFTGASPADCVTWGSFPPPPVFPQPALIPDSQSANASSGGIPDGSSLTRTIAAGCATYLDGADDTGNSSTDFAATAPSPRSNATAPTETRCPPDTVILTFPDNPTSATSATFTFATFSGEPGVEFECELDGDGSFGGPETSDCDSGSKTYESLADGQHVFRVRAIGEGGPDATPDQRTWTVDTIAPQTSILSTPPDPNSGASVTYTYASSEPNSSFRCQLDDGAVQVCAGAGRTYFKLIDGAHTFRVWATDNAGNKDASPATHSFTVNAALDDKSPPDTTILLAPPATTSKNSAFFAYTSSESPASYECSLDGSAFSSCSELGIGYEGLRNGSHTFAVRAIDRAGNVDSVPATHTWRVAAPLPETRITRAPGGRVLLKRKGRRAKAKIVFRFASSAPGSTFRCRLDKKPFRPCRSPRRFKVRPGRHRFEVYAIDALGNADATPARRIFRVQRRGRGGLFR